MVKEIDKTIFNALASGKDIYLPEVGSLVTVCRKAVRRSGKSIVPPQRSVSFTEKACGESVTDAISRAAGIDAEKSRALYNEWRRKAQNDGVLTVEGVGTLKDGVFTVDSGFAALLNPQGAEPTALNPRSSAGVYISAAFGMLITLCIAGYIWYGSVRSDIPAEVRAVAATETPVPTAEAVETSEAAEDVEKAEEVVAPRQDEPYEIVRTSAGRSYVVLGIYSTEENARKAVELAAAKSDAACRIYRYADKYMVSIYEDAERAECNRFMRTASADYPDLWIYTKQ